VKGIEIGDGFCSGPEVRERDNDQMDTAGFLSNHAGGILGGISTGQTLS
jgi:chorismate synthase